MENIRTNAPKRAISGKRISLSLAPTNATTHRIIQVLLLFFFIFSSGIASAQQSEVTLEEAGTLSEKIDSTLKYKITNLKVSGPINGTDVLYLVFAE